MVEKWVGAAEPDQIKQALIWLPSTNGDEEPMPSFEIHGDIRGRPKPSWIFLQWEAELLQGGEGQLFLQHLPLSNRRNPVIKSAEARRPPCSLVHPIASCIVVSILKTSPEQTHSPLPCSSCHCLRASHTPCNSSWHKAVLLLSALPNPVWFLHQQGCYTSFSSHASQFCQYCILLLAMSLIKLMFICLLCPPALEKDTWALKIQMLFLEKLPILLSFFPTCRRPIFP